MDFEIYGPVCGSADFLIGRGVESPDAPQVGKPAIRQTWKSALQTAGESVGLTLRQAGHRPALHSGAISVSRSTMQTRHAKIPPTDEVLSKRCRSRGDEVQIVGKSETPHVISYSFERTARRVWSAASLLPRFVPAAWNSGSHRRALQTLRDFPRARGLPIAPQQNLTLDMQNRSVNHQPPTAGKPAQP